MPALAPGVTVIMDNLASHQVAGVHQAIEAAGAHLRHLPAYSPDSTPIEQAFAKLKALLRTAAARTVPDLWAAIRNAFTCFKPDECRNTVAAAGFDAYDLEQFRLSPSRSCDSKPMEILSISSWGEFAEGESALA